MSKLIAIDAYSVFFRAYYAMPTMIRNNKNVNAVFGFLRQLENVIKIHQPTHLIVALDAGRKTFRSKMQEEFLINQQLKIFLSMYKNILSEELQKRLLNKDISLEDICKMLNIELIELEEKVGYKENRKKLPEDFIEQFDILDTMLKQLNVPHLRQSLYEADDIIATATYLDVKEIVIVSSDKDIIQLVSPKVSFQDIAGKRMFVSDNDVKEKFNVIPKQIPDYLALLGDSSDNIPGVPGIGKVTSAKLISQFENVENMIQNIHLIQNEKIRNTIQEYEEQIVFAKKMTTLKKIEEIQINIENLAFQSINKEILLDFTNTYFKDNKGLSIEIKNGLFS